MADISDALVFALGENVRIRILDRDTEMPVKILQKDTLLYSDSKGYHLKNQGIVIPESTVKDISDFEGNLFMNVYQPSFSKPNSRKSILNRISEGISNVREYFKSLNTPKETNHVNPWFKGYQEIKKEWEENPSSSGEY